MNGSKIYTSCRAWKIENLYSVVVRPEPSLEGLKSHTIFFTVSLYKYKQEETLENYICFCF